MASVTLTFTIKLKRPHLRDLIFKAARALIVMTGGQGFDTITRWGGWAVMVMCYSEPRFK